MAPKRRATAAAADAGEAQARTEEMHAELLHLLLELKNEIEATRTDTGEPVRFTANFLWMCQGYYRHSEGYTPEWEGMKDFKGTIVHPQTWPEDLDYKGK